MKLKNKQKLEWSSIVANNSMNRKRIAKGINSYERDIQFDPIQFIEEKLVQKNIHWIDLCCGEGNALIQVAKHFEANPKVNNLKISGIDLVDYFNDEVNEYKSLIDVQVLNLEYWKPTIKYDLITIVHGLHYVGDKLGLIKKAANALKEDGVLIANLDINHITIQNKKDSVNLLKKYFNKNSIQYNSKTKILKINGTTQINEEFKYIGANDEIGPNYTGQNAVESIYIK